MWMLWAFYAMYGVCLFTGGTRFDKRYWEFYRIVMIGIWAFIGLAIIFQIKL
jgi:hypothetical protein